MKIRIKPFFSAFVGSLCLLLVACDDDPSGDPCDGVTCSFHGTCIVESGTARCDCAPGYDEEGLACTDGVDGDADIDGDADLDADADGDVDGDIDGDADGDVDQDLDADPDGDGDAEGSCTRVFYDDFEDEDITDWTEGSLFYDDRNSTVPRVQGGVYLRGTDGLPGGGGHHRELSTHITGIAFEMRARVRAGVTSMGQTTFGVFADDATVPRSTPPNGRDGHGYICVWYPARNAAEARLTNEEAHTTLAAATVTGDAEWHDLSCIHLPNGEWEIHLDGVPLTLTTNIADFTWDRFEFVTTFIDPPSDEWAIDDIEILDCNPCPSDMVLITELGDVCIDRYEASEGPEGVARSVAGEMPWNNVSHDVAAAACVAAGKRLCAADEWFAACEGRDENSFPYGDGFVEDRCNDHGSAGPLETGSFEECEGGYPGLFDMSGNVAELIAECPTEPCRIRGGSYTAREADLRCTADYEATEHRLPYTGFRCCLSL